jgi:DNA segregation ATPase FtsK/SpoIIIE, S-DNA-T family
MPSNLTPDQLGTLAKLQLKLSSLGVDGHFLPEVKVGPIVTLYKYVPTNATRVSQVENRADDLALALGVDCVQVSRLADGVGIFVPNAVKKLLRFTEAVGAVWNSKAKIPILLGMDHNGQTIVEDLTTLPHLLIAGSTGGGKSTLLNSVISSLMYCRSSDDIKLVLVDTKQVEFTQFQKAPHLLYPVVTSVRRVIDALDDLVSDVETRLQFMARSGAQNILQMHERGKKLSYVVLIIDELADILQDETRDEDEEGKPIGKKYGKQAEYLLGKIVQKARATGIHVIAATQRTSVKVVEGNIKANFPARITFRLPSETDSRTILGTSGAEQLLSQGDMLFISPNSPTIRRIHAPYASIEDIKTAVEMAKAKEESRVKI